MADKENMHSGESLGKLRKKEDMDIKELQFGGEAEGQIDSFGMSMKEECATVVLTEQG